MHTLENQIKLSSVFSAFLVAFSNFTVLVQKTYNSCCFWKMLGKTWKIQGMSFLVKNIFVIDS